MPLVLGHKNHSTVIVLFVLGYALFLRFALFDLIVLVLLGLTSA